MNGDVALYAKWNANSYFVTFNKNNKNATGVMSKQSILYGASESLHVNEYVLEGYSFLGWATAFDGEVEFFDKANYIMRNNNIILYAVWSKEKTSSNIGSLAIALPENSKEIKILKI